MSADPYVLLGVATTATRREIAAAFRRRIRQLHPDAPGGDGELFDAVVAAYTLLRDTQRRAEFDRQRARGIPVPVRHHPVRAEPDLRVGPVRYHRR